MELEGEIDLRVLVLRHWVGNSVWLWWRRNGSIVNEILDLILEPLTVVGGVTGALMVLTIEVGTVIWLWLCWWICWLERFEDTFFDKLSEDDGSWKVQRGDLSGFIFSRLGDLSGDLAYMLGWLLGIFGLVV